MLQDQTVERLLDEFGESLDRRVITEVVSRCAAQLRGQGAPGPALALPGTEIGRAHV